MGRASQKGMEEVKKAYRAYVEGEPTLDFPTASEAVEYAASKVYVSPPRQRLLDLLRKHGRVLWVYGFKAAEVAAIPYSESRM